MLDLRHEVAGHAEKSVLQKERRPFALSLVIEY